MREGGGRKGGREGGKEEERERKSSHTLSSYLVHLHLHEDTVVSPRSSSCPPPTPSPPTT